MLNQLEQRSQPLYQSLVNDIIAQIQAGAWPEGSKLPSERALCERYHVSQITVRRALRELTHLGRVYSRHGLGWFVSAETAAYGAPEATLITPSLTGLSASLAQALAEAFSEQGIALRLACSGGQAEGETLALSNAIARGTNAVLWLVDGEERQVGRRYARLLQNLDLPALLLLRDVDGVDAPAVCLNERLCMEYVTRHLLQLGHQRVAYAGSDPAQIEGQRRYQGFAQTLWESGLELPLDWVFSGSLLGERGAARFRHAFTGPDRPTALACSFDLRAAEALLLLRDMGLRCPDDVAVVGLGDSDLAPMLAPPLTTFRFDLAGLAQAAAATLGELLAGRPAANREVTGQLVTRQSCGAHLAYDSALTVRS